MIYTKRTNRKKLSNYKLQSYHETAWWVLLWCHGQHSVRLRTPGHILRKEKKNNLNFLHKKGMVFTFLMQTKNKNIANFFTFSTKMFLSISSTYILPYIVNLRTLHISFLLFYLTTCFTPLSPNFSSCNFLYHSLSILPFFATPMFFLTLL